MRDYELMVVLDPNLDDAAVESVSDRIRNLVAQRRGTVSSTEPWGKRPLAYLIGRHRSGSYILFRLQIPGDASAEIERSLRLMEPVLRHLLVRVERAEPAAASA